MGQTTWLPRTNFEQPRQWLLTNGDVITEPALEQTTSGRKVRVAGTDMSAYSKDMDELILRAVRDFASAKQADVWMPLAGREDALTSAISYGEGKASNYVLDSDLYAATRVWWRFRHPTLPIEAEVSVYASRVNPGMDSSSHWLRTSIVMPETHRVKQDTWNALATSAVEVTTERFEDAVNMIPDPLERGTARDFIRDSRPDWTSLLGSDTYYTPRTVVEALLNAVRGVEEYDTIQIPDFRDPDNPAWLDLELYDTNLDGSLTADLADYLEGSPTVTEAVRLYRELRNCLRGIGLVMDDKTENDFQSALLNGDNSGLTVEIETLHAPADEGGTDYHHTLTMHLPTGTFVVSCDATVNHGEIADRWDEARTVASLTGEEDTLLAFAREAASQGHKKRVRQTIRERKGA